MTIDPLTRCNNTIEELIESYTLEMNELQLIVNHFKPEYESLFSNGALTPVGQKRALKLYNTVVENERQISNIKRAIDDLEFIRKFING